MILCNVTGTLSAEKRLAELNQVSFVQLHDQQGNALVAVDLLGAQAGDQVVVTCNAAHAILGSNHPADALVLCVLSPNKG